MPTRQASQKGLDRLIKQRKERQQKKKKKKNALSFTKQNDYLRKKKKNK